MEYLIVGIAVAFNVLVVIWKLQNKRVTDGVLDGILLLAVAIVFSGSYGALVVGTIASAVISTYLLINKPQINIDLTGGKLDDYKY